MILAALITTSLTAQAIARPIRVDGDGYLRLAVSGRIVYAKEAVLGVSKGRLSDEKGGILAPAIVVPGSPTGLRVDLDGSVWASYSYGPKSLGRIVLSLLPASARLTHVGAYLASPESAKLCSPGEGLGGVIREGSSEGTLSESVKAPMKAGGQREIRLLPSVNLDGDTVTLGDVAKISGDDAASRELRLLEIGQTPPQAVDRVFERSTIVLKLRKAGFDPESLKLAGAAQIHVRRTSQEVPQSDFIDAALKEAAKSFAGEFEAESRQTVLPMSVPKGEIEMMPEGVVRSGRIVNITVAVYVNGTRFNSRTVVLKAASRALESMHIGQTVSVLLISGGVQVETEGVIASVNTTTGEVKVKTDKGALLTGVPNKSGTVEVKL